MIRPFLTDQIQRILEAAIDTAAGALIQTKARREQSQRIQAAMEQLERDYTGTIIDTDDFQRCFKYHTFSQRIMDYVWHPEKKDQTEDTFLRGLIREYVQSRMQTTKEDEETAPSSVCLPSGDEQTIFRFLKYIMGLYQEFSCKQLDDSDRSALNIATDHFVKIEEKIDCLSLQKDLPASQNSLKSPTAAIFQRKFHKRLFLEPAGGAALCDVYVQPKCNLDDENEMLAFDAVNSFIQNKNEDLMLIEGVAGSGKSSFLAALSETYDTSEYVFVSLKDLIGEQDEIHFRIRLTEECEISSHDTNRVFFLDGFDEISSRIDETDFETDIQWFKDRGHRLIFTARPGYFPSSRFEGGLLKMDLRLFDEEQIEIWLNLYGRLNPDLLPSTCEALMQLSGKRPLEEVRQIPIMLYVIANRNINVDTVSCMGELYQQVFDNLKRDKAGVTTRLLEQHYQMAQILAYHMEMTNTLQASVSQTAQWGGELFDNSFFSSVYVENSIIEGISILEFVHKSILEFFASKWIYKNLQEKDTLYRVLTDNYISDEVLEYLQYFYSQEKNVSVKAKLDALIPEAFRGWIEEGIPFAKSRMNVMELEDTNSFLFYNFAVLIKQLLHHKQFMDMELTKACGGELCTILRTFLLDGITKPSGRNVILTDEDFSYLHFPGYMDFAGWNLEGTIWDTPYLEYISFWEADLTRTKFESAGIHNCTFDHAKLAGAIMNKVEFDNKSLVNICFDSCTLSRIRMPKGYLNMKSFCQTYLEEVTFEFNTLSNISFESAQLNHVSFSEVYLKNCSFRQAQFDDVEFRRCRFVNCDFSGIVCKGKCAFSQCKIDKRTRSTNPEVFGEGR